MAAASAVLHPEKRTGPHGEEKSWTRTRIGTQKPPFARMSSGQAEEALGSIEFVHGDALDRPDWKVAAALATDAKPRLTGSEGLMRRDASTA